ncbi:hypothetical protein F4823DRAFT_614106 [Ustulina deusta]|nr:hypothetical protein F4823DRAFT_614106 [Ustulina deusta]
MLPACVVSPQSAEDVSGAITSLVSQEPPLTSPFDQVVTQGGRVHQNIADGVIIDLRALNTVEPSADKSTVMVGTGATWDAV